MLSCAAVRAEDITAAIGWHEKYAAVRFRIEKDDDQSLIPEVSLLDVPPDKKSEAVQKWIEENRWSERRQFQGKLCLNCLPAFGSEGIVYNLHRDFTHFVSRAGIYDSTDPNTVVIFEVYADGRPIFRSGPVTRQKSLVEINAGIPARSRRLKLVVKTDEGRFRNRARWIDPGFVLRGRYPKVSFARLYAPGYNPADFVPEVYATTSGEKVNSRVLSAAQGEAMEVLIESPVGNPSYLVYLAPRDRHSESRPSWQPQAGIVLETRWSGKGLKSSDRLPEFMAVFDCAEPVGRSLVDDIQQAFPIHRMPECRGTDSSRRGGYGFYRYEGFFAVQKEGQYSFATISRWDSYLSIDGKLVVDWPGQHDIHEGRRGEKIGTISLASGIHKLEYFNYSPWGQMFTLAAWKKPGEELRPMTRTDFLPVGRFNAVAADFSDPNRVYAAFEWSVADDSRLDQDGPAFVTMRFKAIRPERLTRYDYRWTFDDGTVATGEAIDHVFLRPAVRKVQLDVSLAGEHLAAAASDVHVHPAWDKCLTYIDNIDAYDQVIKERTLEKAPPDDLVNLFILAEMAHRPDWKSLATAALTEHVDGLVWESENTDFFFDFGQYLRSPGLKEYDKSLELFTRLAEKPGVDQSVRRKAVICRAEVLLTYFGRNDEALKILNQLTMQNASPDWNRRVVVAKAQAMLALGQATEAIDLLRPLSSSWHGLPARENTAKMAMPRADATKQHIKHAGLIRHARVLTQSTNDPNPLDFAMMDIETVMTEDPMTIFSPGVNLVKLDIHLARGEFQAAYHLTERLKNLQLSDYDIAEVLARQVIAACGLKDTEKAKSVYAQLSKDYPSSPAADQAKQALLHALGQ